MKNKVITYVHDNLKMIAGIITAGTVLVGSFNTLFTIVENNKQVLAEIKQIRLDEVRTQLLVMIYHNPTDHATILEVAEEYFVHLEGDWYMTDIFNTWAGQQGIDASQLVWRQK